jgi:hypothetical protein
MLVYLTTGNAPPGVGFAPGLIACPHPKSSVTCLDDKSLSNPEIRDS